MLTLEEMEHLLPADWLNTYTNRLPAAQQLHFLECEWVKKAPYM